MTQGCFLQLSNRKNLSTFKYDHSRHLVHFTIKENNKKSTTNLHLELLIVIIHFRLSLTYIWSRDLSCELFTVSHWGHKLCIPAKNLAYLTFVLVIKNDMVIGCLCMCAHKHESEAEKNDIQQTCRERVASDSYPPLVWPSLSYQESISEPPSDAWSSRKQYGGSLALDRAVRTMTRQMAIKLKRHALLYLPVHGIPKPLMLRVATQSIPRALHVQV